MIKPSFSGKLYEDSFENLNKQIEEAFQKGPGDLPIKRSEKEVNGIIVPNHGYNLSGRVAAWAYKELAESKFPDFYLILGKVEGDMAYLSMEDFETPLGIVKNAKFGLVNDHIIVNDELHIGKKDIEVQLPFLQHASKDQLDKLQIMPLLLGDLSYEAIVSIAETLNNFNNFVVIVSSEFTRYGEKFGNVPFRFNVQEEVKNLDVKSFELIKGFKNTEFWEHSNNCSITLLLELLKDRCPIGRLLDYKNSGDFTGDYDNFVSYGSLVF